jgi:Phosphoglycerate dehydrogenase and related dehydrogenases
MQISWAELRWMFSERSPLPEDSRLWKAKNLLITPHCAGNLTIDYTRDKNVELFCENLINYVEGKPLNHVVDKEKRY